MPFGWISSNELLMIVAGVMWIKDQIRIVGFCTNGRHFILVGGFYIHDDEGSLVNNA